MANTTLRGFRFKSTISGDLTTPAFQRIRLASGYTPQIGASGTYNLKVGDPITQRSTGYAEASIGSEGTQDDILGIVAGFGPIYNATTGRMEAVTQFSGGGGVYGTAYERMSWVYYIPTFGNIFEVDADDGSSIITEANWIAAVGENADHVLTSGSTPDLNPLLDISTHATTASLQWRILDYAPRVDNDLTVTRAKVLVTCNRVQMASRAATIMTAT